MNKALIWTMGFSIGVLFGWMLSDEKATLGLISACVIVLVFIWIVLVTKDR